MALTPTRRIALFGGTGGTGSATLRSFIKCQNFKDDSLELRIMVRSKAKLFRMIPELQSYPNICEGQLTDTEKVRNCLRDADTIICALGENSNIPGCHVLQDLCKSIVDVLTDLKMAGTGQWKRPRLILLSSSTWNARFAAQEPAIVIWLLKTAFYHPYLDLRLATSHLSSSTELLSLLLVQPSALVEDEPAGMEISTESISLAVSYSDLGDAFVELTMEESYSKLDAVGVSSKGRNQLRKYGLELLSRIVRGFIVGYMPGYWAMVKLVGRLRRV